MDVAVVTGAAHGIGRAICTRLTSSGCSVVGVDLSEDGLDELVDREPRFVKVVGDVSDDAVLRHAREKAEALGLLTAWVNNAATPGLGALHEIDASSMRRIVEVNLLAGLTGCQQALQSFLTHSTRGSIVNISSIHARASFPGFAVYDSCKGGIEALTRYVCVEYGPRGIRCNAVAPGVVDTPFVLSADEQRREELRGYSPMGQLTTASDVAGVVMFLLSGAARHVNGHVLAIDGGMAARCLALPSSAASLGRDSTDPSVKRNS